MKRQIEVLQSDNARLDDNIKKILDGTFPLPQKVEYAREEAFAKVRARAAEEEGKKEQNGVGFREEKHQKIRKMLFPGLAGAGVAIATFSCILFVNPTVVAQVPLVRHVFEKVGNSLKFAGNYDELAEPVDRFETEMESRDVNGTTITLSEAYCNEAALYLSLVIRSKERFPETYPDENGKPMINMNSLIDFDFDEEGSIDWAYVGDSTIDGEMVDENTYAGVIRFDMGQYFSDKGIEVPENFQVKLSVSEIVGTKLHDTRPEMPKELREQYELAMEENGLGLTEEDYEQFTEEQKDIEHRLFNDMWNAYYELYPDRQKYPNKYDNWWMYGPWEFEFNISRNDKSVIRKDINDVDENGLGIISVTKTPMEITVEMEENLDCFAAILDADGRLMGNDVPGYGNTVAVSGYDTSKIYVYICDYVEYMDELKGVWWSDSYEESVKGEVFKQLLDERSLYHKEIIFDE